MHFVAFCKGRFCKICSSNAVVPNIQQFIMMTELTDACMPADDLSSINW